MSLRLYLLEEIQLVFRSSHYPLHPLIVALILLLSLQFTGLPVQPLLHPLIYLSVLSTHIL